MINYSYGIAQSVGKLRKTNQDALFGLRSVIISGDNIQSIGLFMIADGMGGHLYGEIASNVAIRTTAEYIIAHLFVPSIRNSNVLTPNAVNNVLKESIELANQNVSKSAPGGGTTFSAGLLIDNQISIIHIGDSRIYYVSPDGNMQLLTQDHSWVGHLIERGQITSEEAQSHPQRNVLYQALGQNIKIKPYTNRIQIPDSGHYLLCSDGLWGSVTEKNIFKIIKTTTDPQDACNSLIEAANEAGGEDNISAILLKL